MRNCDNCYYGSYGLDCNTGIETLYCRKNRYEHEVCMYDQCESHQFIDGYESEKNYLFYDESYLGKGYFIIHKKDDKIDKFFKMYIMNDNGFPSYGLRAFSVDGRDNPDFEFNSIDFTFRSREDFESGLYDIFYLLSKNVLKIETINKIQQGENNVSLSIDNNIIKFSISKDIFGGKQHPCDYIDIDLGDNETCKNYGDINAFFNSMVQLCSEKVKEQDIKRLIMQWIV